MKILILSHYFWPENFKINELAEFLSKNNKITVLTGYPSYPSKELFNKINQNYTNIKILKLLEYQFFPEKKIDLVYF